MERVNKYLVMALLGMALVAPVSAKFGDGQLKQEIKTLREDRREMIKDIRKKTLIEKFDKQVLELNTRRTSEMKKVLEKLAITLAKVEAKRSVSNVDAAKALINTAKQAVNEQAAKTYTVNITDETKLKEAAGRVKSQLEVDLKIVNEKVKAARKGVVKLIKGSSV